MREIKFRAWDGTEMHYNVCINHEGAAIKHGYRATDWVDDARAGKPMQFTGLHDRNGKEVYEGDVLMADNYKVEIQYRGGQFVGYNPNYSITETQNRNWLQWEIIGNLYENPELI